LQLAVFLALLSAPFALAQAPPSASPFVSIPAPASDSFRFGARLPTFQVQDLAGRTWNLADVRGKFTLVYIWQPFEASVADRVGPRGRASIGGLPDLADVQLFYDEVRYNPKLQVLTFCSGQKAEAQRYLQNAGYTFPVIADWRLGRTLFPEASGQGPGRLWVVNPQGRLSLAFRQWGLGRVILEMRDAASH
jgi:hypothetical protein